MKEFITLAEGSGGKEMSDLIQSFGFRGRGKWRNVDDDSSTYPLGDGRHLVFTTDSFIVDPIFFPGGNIGDLAFSGTVNDLLMMGGDPIGLSLGIILEEGLNRKDLVTIINTIKHWSQITGIPIATGDTKVMDRGKLDRIIINTSGVGIAERLLDDKPEPGDNVIISGGIGEHATALLSTRFDFTTAVTTDSHPLIKEMAAVKGMIKTAKDPTRGGLSAVLNEMAESYGTGIMLDEGSIPMKEGVRSASQMLGIDPLELACEGIFVCVTSRPKKVVSALKEFNMMACVIGKIIKGDKVLVQTNLGKRILTKPRGRIVPRIC